MDHGGATFIAQYTGDFLAMMTADFLRITHVLGAQAAGDFVFVLIAHNHHIAALKGT